MFKTIGQFFKNNFKWEPIIENPLGRTTPGIKFSLNSKREKMISRVNEVILNKSPNTTKIKKDSSFTLDLGFDSLDFVEVIMCIEEEFSIELPDEETEKVITVGDIYDLVEKYVE